jgi:large subunit ribosomal protein L17
MRHGKKVNHLGRTSSHRKAMMSNMACSLILHKRINTTLAKAKALRVYVEPLITKSKNDSTHSRRIVFGYLKQKEAVAMLFRDVAVKIATRPGGYTRILKTGNRLGDNAEMCMIELVDFNEYYQSEGKAASKKAKPTRRSRSTAPKASSGEVEKPSSTPEGGSEQ